MYFIYWIYGIYGIYGIYWKYERMYGVICLLIYMINADVYQFLICQNVVLVMYKSQIGLTLLKF